MKKMMLAACLAVMALTACGSKEDAAVKAAAEMPRSASMTSAQPSAAIRSADRSVPLDQYQARTRDLSDWLYFALSAQPVDYEKVAWAMSGEYRAASDAFKKKDLMDALKPQIDAKLAEVRKSGRYLYVDFAPGTVSLGHYDLATKSFPISGLDAASMRLTNGNAFQALPMLDENKAREVEASITKGVAYDVSPSEKSLGVPGRFPTIARLYVFAHSVGPDGGPVQYEIVRLVMKTTEGMPFAEL